MENGNNGFFEFSGGIQLLVEAATFIIIPKIPSLLLNGNPQSVQQADDFGKGKPGFSQFILLRVNHVSDRPSEIRLSQITSPKLRLVKRNILHMALLHAALFKMKPFQSHLVKAAVFEKGVLCLIHGFISSGFRLQKRPVDAHADTVFENPIHHAGKFPFHSGKYTVLKRTAAKQTSAYLGRKKLTVMKFTFTKHLILQTILFQ